MTLHNDITKYLVS